MKTRVTVKNFAVAEKCFHHAVKEGLMKNKRMPSGHVIYCCPINILLLLHNRY